MRKSEVTYCTRILNNEKSTYEKNVLSHILPMKHSNKVFYYKLAIMR